MTATKTQTEPSPRRARNVAGKDLAARGVFAALGLGAGVAMFLPNVDQMGSGFAALLLMLVLMFAKVPIAIALCAPGLLGIYAISGDTAATAVLSTLPMSATAQWSLTVIPMFVFLGLLLGASGMTSSLYRAANHWLGWLPGGLAVGTNSAGAALSAVSGSTISITYALGRVGIPEMLKAGYDRRLALVAVMVSGLPGNLIPPSIMLVIYAGIAQVPVGPQLMAGTLPGLLVAVVFALLLVGISIARPTMGGRGGGQERNKSSWKQKFSALPSALPLFIVIFVVLGGIFSGWLTATESGAAAAFLALLMTLVLKRRDRPFIAVKNAGMKTVATTGAIFFMILGAYTLAQLLALSGIGAAFSTWITGLGLSPIQFLLLLMVAYLLMGMFMDPIAMLLVTVPLLLPTMSAFEISPLWFGVFAVFMAELAFVTPPVGVLSYIVHSLCQERAVNLGHKISLGDVFVAVAWFMPVALIIAIMLIFIPELATWLPGIQSS